MKLPILALLLTAGNLAYQLMQTVPDFAVAFERSYFQACALVAVWLFIGVKA